MFKKQSVMLSKEFEGNSIMIIADYMAREYGYGVNDKVSKFDR